VTAAEQGQGICLGQRGSLLNGAGRGAGKQRREGLPEFPGRTRGSLREACRNPEHESPGPVSG